MTRRGLAVKTAPRLGPRVGPKTVVGCERGTIFQSKAADALMRLLRENPENARHLARLHDVVLKSAA